MTRCSGKIRAKRTISHNFRLGGLVALWLFFLHTVALGQQTTRAQPAFRISGTVVNGATSQPVAQVRLFLSPVQARQEIQVVITGAGGHFQFDGLPAGKYALGAGRPGFVMEGFEEHENFSSAIAVGPDRSADNLVFRLDPDSVISGQIIDEQNEPVRDAQVMLFRSRLLNGKRVIRHAGQTLSDDRGQYRFGSLARGTYFVMVSARPWFQAYTAPAFTNTESNAGQDQNSNASIDVTYSLVYYSGATDSGQATPLTLAPGDHVSADFSLTPVRSLHIHVRTPQLNPSQGYSVQVTPEAFSGVDLRMPVSVQTTMSKPGEVEITGLAPGQYRLQMVFPGKETLSYSQEIDLQSDTEIDASSSEQGRTISGTVRMQDGSRLPSGMIVFLRSATTGEAAGGAQVSRDGQFQFSSHQVIPSGNYEIGIGSQNVFAVSTAATGARVAGRMIEIRGSGPIRLSLIVAQGVARVEGTAVSGDDKPFAGAMVLMLPDDPANNAILIRRDQSDSDGTFTLPNVVPGHYTLLAIKNGWNLEWMNPEALKPYLQGGESVRVERNGRYNLKVRVQ